MSARVARFTAAFQALLLMATLLLPALASAAVWTDQADYAPGSVVTISGDNSDGAGFLEGETVNVDVTGPNGFTESCSAIADEAGAWSCQITLWASDLAVGSYSYVATGQTSGTTQTGLFDDSVTLNVAGSGTLPGGYKRTISLGGGANGFNLTVGGAQLCTTASSGGNRGCSSPTSLLVEIYSMSVGNPVVANLSCTTSVATNECGNWSAGGTGTTFKTSTPAGDWTATFKFRTSATPPLEDSIPADGTYGVRVTMNATFTNPVGSTEVSSKDNYVVVDNTAPTITPTVNPASPAASGWYNLSIGAPSVSFACSDALSQPSGSWCPNSVSLGNGNPSTWNVTATDLAGNIGSSSGNRLVDRIAPTISAALSPASPAFNGWYNASGGAPTVTYTCGDTGSSTLFSCSSPHLFGDGENQSDTGTAVDVAGNTKTASVSDVDVDTVGPDSTINAPSIGATSISVGGLTSDATSLPKSVIVELFAGTCVGSPIASSTDNSVGSGAWSVNLSAGGYNNPGAYCIRSTATDNAGNAQAVSTTRNYDADAAPSVATTDPGDGELDVPVDANIIVTFDEPVTVDTSSPNWISVACDGGAHPGSTTDAGDLDPATWLFNPTVDFAGLENCTATIHFQQIHDVDTNDPPDELDGTYTFDFTTASSNQPPTANAGGSYTGDEGSAIVIDGTASSDPDGDSLTYDWDIDYTGIDAGGSCTIADESAPSTSVTCNDDSNGLTFTLTLTVADPSGESDEDTATLSVANVAPTATFNSPDVNEGTAISLSLTGGDDASSRDDAAGFTYAFDCGSGYGPFSSTSSASCPTTDNGTRAVGGKIKDKDGYVTTYTDSVTISNVAPTVDLADDNPTTANEGDTETFFFSVSDPGSADTHTIVDADCSSNGTTSNETYSDITRSGSFDCTFIDGLNPAVASTIGIQVRDDDGADSNVDTAQVTVSNVAPTVALPAWTATQVCQGSAATLGGLDFSDPGVDDDPWALDISWGDTTHTTDSLLTQDPIANQSHTYNTPGTYNATVKVTDKDNEYGSNSTAIALTVVAHYRLTFLQPIDGTTTGVQTNGVKLGRVVPVKIMIWDNCANSFAGGWVTDPLTNVRIRAGLANVAGGTLLDSVETYADAGAANNNTLNFRWTADSSVAGGGFWIYNLDTKNSNQPKFEVLKTYRIDATIGGVLATGANSQYALLYMQK